MTLIQLIAMVLGLLVFLLPVILVWWEVFGFASRRRSSFPYARVGGGILAGVVMVVAAALITVPRAGMMGVASLALSIVVGITAFSLLVWCFQSIFNDKRLSRPAPAKKEVKIEVPQDDEEGEDDDDESSKPKHRRHWWARGLRRENWGHYGLFKAGVHPKKKAP